VILGTRIVAGYIGYREHVVRSGDTLWAIGEGNYGKGSDSPLIARANPSVITDPHLIFRGQVLKIPSHQGVRTQNSFPSGSAITTQGTSP